MGCHGRISANPDINSGVESGRHRSLLPAHISAHAVAGGPPAGDVCPGMIEDAMPSSDVNHGAGQTYCFAHRSEPLT
eukprot:scaffold151560_cov51-Prasinocladus_malaysianus.AAC.1